MSTGSRAQGPWQVLVAQHLRSRSGVSAPGSFPEWKEAWALGVRGSALSLPRNLHLILGQWFESFTLSQSGLFLLCH